MITLTVTIHEIPILATITESVGSGFFASKIRRYLKETINSIPPMTDTSTAMFNIDDWVGIWVLSTLYMSEVSGPSTSLMHKIEDALAAVNPVISETTDPYIVIS